MALRKKEMCRLLMKAGADPNLENFVETEDDHGERPCDTADTEVSQRGSLTKSGGLIAQPL